MVECTFGVYSSPNFYLPAIPTSCPDCTVCFPVCTTPSFLCMLTKPACHPASYTFLPPPLAGPCLHPTWSCLPDSQPDMTLIYVLIWRVRSCFLAQGYLVPASPPTGPVSVCLHPSCPTFVLGHLVVTLSVLFLLSFPCTEHSVTLIENSLEARILLSAALYQINNRKTKKCHKEQWEAASGTGTRVCGKMHTTPCYM